MQPMTDDTDLDALAAGQGRINARPAEAAEAVEPGSAGQQPLGLDERRDGLLYVPDGYDPARPAPLILMLHGAGGTGERALARLRRLADGRGLILLSPDSRSQTWDVLRGGYGPDVLFINRALAQTFGRFTVDPARVAIEGFSDGASYALSLGIANGDLFTHIIAFSPGFAAPPGQAGSPRVYMSHGTEDKVLPIDYCSRQLAPQLRRAGYDLTYTEFDGPHTVPPWIADEAIGWFLEPNPRSLPSQERGA